jgi:hypothetical protein
MVNNNHQKNYQKAKKLDHSLRVPVWFKKLLKAVFYQFTVFRVSLSILMREKLTKTDLNLPDCGSTSTAGKKQALQGDFVTSASKKTPFFVCRGFAK